MPTVLVGELSDAPFTYGEVGATAREGLPAGYGRFERWRNLLPEGFDSAAARLMTWRIHEAVGLKPSASSPRVEEGAVVEMFLGPRWVGLRAVCRVVYAINEPDRVGFAYGTLPGHPERGEESFILDRRDGVPRFTVRAFSKPASLLSRMGGPLTGRVQFLMADRYLRAAAPDPTAASD